MELDFVAWLRGRLPETPHVALGVGDDAAVVDLSSPRLVVTTDLLIDGVHFRTDEHAPERIGRKTLAVNLSDLAAMAARPVGAVLSFALPRAGAAGREADELARGMVEGMGPLSEQFACPLVGGDTNVGDGPLVVSVTAFGEPTGRGVVRRDGAQPGDVLMVTGELGGSLAGKHLDFTPRIDEALALNERVELHAMMDVTDGLSLDLRRMCEASGVGAVVDAASVPIAELVSADDRPIERALSDGEDFELLLSVGAEVADRLLADPPLGCGLSRIGEVTGEPGLRLRLPSGELTPLASKGYEHR